VVSVWVTLFNWPAVLQLKSVVSVGCTICVGTLNVECHVIEVVRALAVPKPSMICVGCPMALRVNCRTRPSASVIEVSAQTDASASQGIFPLIDIDLAALPDDVETLQNLVRSLAAERASLSEAKAEIERLNLIIKKLQRSQFGRRAERLDDGQLQLGLEDLNTDLAHIEASLPSFPQLRPRRRRHSVSGRASQRT
jgi:hypothetical protein